MAGEIGPDHPLVKSGAVTLTKVGGAAGKDEAPAGDGKSGTATPRNAFGYPESWGRPGHPATHGATSSASSAAPSDNNTSMDEDAGGPDNRKLRRPAGRARAHAALEAAAEKRRQKEKKKKKKKRKRRLTRMEKAERLTRADARARLARSMSMGKVRWLGATHVVNTVSHLVRSSSMGGPVGPASGGGGEYEDASADPTAGKTAALSELAPCPSPAWIRGVPHKSGLVESRTAWNPSPGSHHIQEIDDSSTTFAMAELKDEARKRHIQHERRARKRRAKLKRKKELKRKLRGHTLAVQSIFRLEKGKDTAIQDEDEEAGLNKSVLGLIGGRVVRLLDGNKDAPSKTAAAGTGDGDKAKYADAHKGDGQMVGDVQRKGDDVEGMRDMPAVAAGSGGTLPPGATPAAAEQETGDQVAVAGPDDVVTAKPATPKRSFSFAALTKKKEKGPTEEEIEAAKRARIDAFKREQAEKVRKEMQRREAQWQKDWENMYKSRQKDVLPDGSPQKTSRAAGTETDDALAQSAAVRRQKKEERRKKARAKRDKEIMREQRRRIRRREKRKIEAQTKLARLHVEHARWVESEMKRDADLVSGKHLGVEEMLFVVQARNSEACHPAFSGYNITDSISRAPCPVSIMHPAFHGYALVSRTRDWEAEAEQEEIKWDRDQLRGAKLAKASEKRQENLDAILAARNGEGEGAGSRKQRREAAKEKKERKAARAKDKKLKAKKVEEEAKEAALLAGVTDPLASAYTGHPAFWIAPRDKTQRPKQLKALAKMEGVAGSAAAPAASAAAKVQVAGSLNDQSIHLSSCIADTTSPGAIVKGTVLHTHPAHFHRPGMDEAFAEARLAARVAKKKADRQAARDGRLERFLARMRFQDEEMHPSWRGMWRKYRLSQNPISLARALPNPHTSNPVFFQRLPVPLIEAQPEPEPELTFEPPLRWGRPARCPVCQAPPGVQGRPGCPACYRTKARLPWTFPSRDLPEVFPPPFERDHGVVRLRAKRKKNKAEREARRKKKAAAQVGGSGGFDVSAQPSLAGGGSTLSLLGSSGGVDGALVGGGRGGTTSFLGTPIVGGSSILSPGKSPGPRGPGARELAARERRRLEKKDDMNAAAGMKRAAMLANSHTPMIDRKALLQHRKLGGIAFVTVWLKTIPGGTCVKLIIDKHETVERIRFLFLANSGEYGPESWGYMVLPTDLGCFFLDERCRYPTELRNGYLPGDRDLTDYGVGNAGSGVPEVVILMVSAGGGRTELNHRTMSEMLRRYFFQNANVEHDEKGRPMHLPVNIIERVMKPRWGKDGAPDTFPAADNAQKQLRRMCKNQLRIKREAWEADMEVLRLADLHQRQAAYKEHLRRTLRAKLEGYRKAQVELKHQHHVLRHDGEDHQKTDAELKISEETVDAALMMLEDHGSEAMAQMSHMSTGEILKQGRKSAKRRRLQNRIAVMKQKEKRFLRDSQARTLAGFNDIPMYVFRKWKPPPVPPPPPPPPPRRPGILTRFATFVYRGVLKPIGSGVVSKYRAIKNMRDTLKEAIEADGFESSSEEEDNAFADGDDDEDSGDELPVNAPVDFFGESGGE